MNSLMLDIIICEILIVVIAFGTLLLFSIVYDYFSTNVKKKKLKKYEINYSIYEYASKCHIRAKNKKQAIKDFYKWSVHIRDVKEVE